MAIKLETAVFGGGCFWCTEAVFQELKGVASVVSGYAGSPSLKASADQAVKPPTYEEVSTGKTGHAEVIKIEFDPEEISYKDLLGVFFSSHNPTTPNRQGADVGEQYRSVILYTTEEQKREAEDYIKILVQSGAYKDKIVTEVKPLEKFFEAEGYHQDFYENNKHKPYCELVIDPKIEKLKKEHADLLKKDAE